jgi:bicarbonate transport system ATP-binding protein
MEVVEHPSYYSLRSEMIYFLNQQKRIKKIRARKNLSCGASWIGKSQPGHWFHPPNRLRSHRRRQEKGFFAKHGLDEVNLVRETSWRGVVRFSWCY